MVIMSMVSHFLITDGLEWFWMDGTSLQEYFVNAGVLQGSVFCFRLFLLSIKDTIKAHTLI